ncbi:unnamed protein product, partial [marine sediment metagenome]
MAVTDDVIAKCAEIERVITIFRHLIKDAETAWWVAGDPGYTDFKSILDVQSDEIVVFTNQLEALT